MESALNQKYTNEQYTNGKYSNEKYANEKYTSEKQPSNVFLTKWNGKCTQLNKKVVLLDSKCTWSNINWDSQRDYAIKWANSYNT